MRVLVSKHHYTLKISILYRFPFNAKVNLFICEKSSAKVKTHKLVYICKNTISSNLKNYYVHFLV